LFLCPLYFANWLLLRPSSFVNWIVAKWGTRRPLLPAVEALETALTYVFREVYFLKSFSIWLSVGPDTNEMQAKPCRWLAFFPLRCVQGSIKQVGEVTLSQRFFSRPHILEPTLSALRIWINLLCSRRFLLLASHFCDAVFPRVRAHLDLVSNSVREMVLFPAIPCQFLPLPTSPPPLRFPGARFASGIAGVD